MPLRTSLCSVVLVLAAGACGRGGDITLTGRIGAGVSQAPLEGRSTRGDVTTLEQPLRTSAGPISSVLLYRGFGLAERATVAGDGTFSLSADRGQPAGLVFLDPTDAVVGTLALPGGVAALPLMLAADGVSQVDLATIDFDGGVGTPATDPTAPGGALALTATEQAAWALQSALFTTLVRNLDMDSDDQLDVLSARRYWLMFGANYNGGQAATSPPGGGAAMTVRDFHLSFSDRQPVTMNPPPALRLPDGTTLNQVSEALRWAGDPDGSQLPTYVWGTTQHASAFVAGQYRITYGQPARQLDFDVSSPLTAQQHLVAGGLWWDQPDPAQLRLHWTWTLVGPGASSVGAGVDLSRLVNLLIVTVVFADGSATHKDTPDPGQTSFVPDLAGHGVDQATAVRLTSRDLFGNEYSVEYRLR